jgi:hypothetical protein
MRALVAVFAGFLGLSVVLVACDSGEEGQPPPDPVVLFPMEVGAQWVMSYTLTDSTGQVFQTRVDTLAISRDTLIGNERWFYLELVDFGSILPREQGYFANRSDGVYRLVPRDDGSLQPALYYPSTAEPGDSHEIAVPYSEDYLETATMTFVSAEDPFEIPGVGVVPSYLFRRRTTSLVIPDYGTVDVTGLVTEIRFSPAYGLLQTQDVTAFRRDVFHWRLIERVGPAL